jgi:hypothetical protein
MTFQLPITYLVNKQILAQNILTDLELTRSEDNDKDNDKDNDNDKDKDNDKDNDKDTNKSMYDHVLLGDQHKRFAYETIPLWSKYYTTDQAYLKDTQKLLQMEEVITPITTTLETEMLTIYDEIQDKLNSGTFLEHYQYVEYTWLEHFNKNAFFLQCLSAYNMGSPILSLLIPVIFLILPFFILKLQGIPISLGKYGEVLKTLFQRHQIGQLFSLQSASYEKMVYIIVSVVFYVWQIYQNIMTCAKFYSNMRFIHTKIFALRDYLKLTLQVMTQFTEQSRELITYQAFLVDMQKQQRVLVQLETDLQKIHPYTLSCKKLLQIGEVMKCFYEINKTPEYQEALKYSFGLHGYLGNLASLRQHIASGNISLCKLVKSKTKTKRLNKKDKTCFKQAYFPPLTNANPVKNTYDLANHLLLTGPNAAGKTTLLKTTLFNIILTQQIGFGYYAPGSVLCPYDILHCYINIPDTSGRDSLFQAEARRCKDILDSVAGNETSNNLRHFCVFDELYSGTNPYEAIGSAYGFLKYLNTFPNVTFMLTTHYLEICHRLLKEQNVENFHMEILDGKGGKDLDFTYTYKLKPGISAVKGGVKVLKELHYPASVIQNASQVIAQLHI